MQWSVFLLLNHPAEHITPGELNTLGSARARERSILEPCKHYFTTVSPHGERVVRGLNIPVKSRPRALGSIRFTKGHLLYVLSELLQLCHNLARRRAQINDRKPNKWEPLGLVVSIPTWRKPTTINAAFHEAWTSFSDLGNLVFCNYWWSITLNLCSSKWCVRHKRSCHDKAFDTLILRAEIEPWPIVWLEMLLEMQCSVTKQLRGSRKRGKLG